MSVWGCFWTHTKLVRRQKMEVEKWDQLDIGMQLLCTYIRIMQKMEVEDQLVRIVVYIHQDGKLRIGDQWS